MNIDNLMDQLIGQGVDFKTLSKAFDDAVDRKTAKDTQAVEAARANVMQALRKYCTILYGAVDEQIMAEFEQTLKGLEKFGKPNTFKVEMKKDDESVDEEKLRKFLRAMTKF